MMAMRMSHGFTLKLLGPQFLYLHLAAVAGAAIAFGFLINPDLVDQRAQWIDEAKTWAIHGPPCPERPVSAAEPWRYSKGPDFGYTGWNFQYAYGHVACIEVHDNGGRSALRGHAVCQFSSPGMVVVRSGKQTTVFEPGLGRRATVSLEGGAPHCVIGGAYKF